MFKLKKIINLCLKVQVLIIIYRVINGMFIPSFMLTNRILNKYNSYLLKKPINSNFNMYSIYFTKPIFYYNKPFTSILYTNADKDKLVILQDNQNKSGISMWTNLKSGKRYIGSSVNLRRRFMEYYNVNHLLTNNSMAIIRALLKYGFSNFSLKILEDCDINILMNREKYYFYLLLPEYNLALLPGAPSRGKGRILSLKINWVR